MVFLGLLLSETTMLLSGKVLDFQRTIRFFKIAGSI